MKLTLDIFTRNWKLKLFSLFVSGLLYLFVSVENNTLVEVDINIEYRTSDNLMLTSDVPRKLVATMKGPWATFIQLDKLPPLVLDLRESEPGTTMHRIDPSDVETPAGMKVVAIRPSAIEISLDRRVEKMVSVEVDPLGRPAFGFEIVEMRADPPRIRVEGPLSRIRTVDFVHTRPVDLRDREDDLTREVELRPPAPPVYLTDRTSVTVFVDITEELTQRPFDVPVAVVGADGTATPDTVTVTLKGPRRFVDRLAKDALVAEVDVADEAEEGEEEVRKVVIIRDMPDRTEIIGGAPMVTVDIAKGKRN